MKTALVIGYGYLGRELTALLKERGIEVRVWDKDKTKYESKDRIVGHEGVELLVSADRVDVVDVVSQKSEESRDSGESEMSSVDSPKTWREKHPLFEPDYVFFCAATKGGTPADYESLYGIGLRNVLDAFPKAVCILSSSTSVYGQQKGEKVTEDSIAEPLTERGRILRQAENTVLDAGGIVARLSNIYGMGRSVLLARFWQGSAEMEGTGDRIVNHVFVGDIARAYLVLATTPSARGRLFNVSDSLPISQKKLFRALSALLHKPMPRVVADRRELSKRGWSSKAVSNAKMLSLGWEPRYPSFLEAVPDLCESLGFVVEDQVAEEMDALNSSAS